MASRSSKPERNINKGLEIEGCYVEFPFEPYECQRDYMGRVIRALREGKNALLESPTGTGKTLCLLCATLAWRESLKGYRHDKAPPTNANPWSLSNPPAPAASSSRSSGAGSAGSAAPGGASQPAVDPALAHLHPALQAILSANGPNAAAANNKAVAAAAGMGAESGLGGSSSDNSALPAVIYSSRTHSQLAQVIKELKNTSYRDRIRSTVLSSRQQTCLHPQVSKMSGGQANQGCKALVSQKKCGWYNNLKYSSRSKDWSTKLDSVPDIEDLVSVGRGHTLCPFYMSKDAAKDADIIFMPYNYLLDANTRKTLVDQVRWDNAIVIFDEAHNVEGVCSDASSCDLTAKQLTDALAEAKRCKEVCLERIERGATYDPSEPTSERNINHRQLYTDLDLFQRLLKQIEQGLQGLVSQHKVTPQEGLTRPGIFLFEFLRGFNITESTLPILNTSIDTASDMLQAWELEQGRSAASKGGTAALLHIQAFLNLAFNTLDPIGTRPGSLPAHKGYRVHIHLEKSWGADKLHAPTLSYWCFIPGMAFRMLKALNLRSILLTSGTLAPLDSFAHELQLQFDIRLENPHIIQASQVWVGVLAQGPSGHSLCSNYQARNDIEYKEDLGNAVANFARIVPDGLLVFFPSYGVLEMCLKHWRENEKGSGGNTMSRITRHKAPFIEPRDGSQFQQVIDGYKSKLEEPTGNGAIFFAVCRGKVSEGLDFSDRAGRGVIITGIPYAMRNDPKVRLKRDVLDEDARTTKGGGPALTGDAWYVQQAMRAVNQAMGRVIRHRWDFGAVILADRRFAEKGTQRQMSKWLEKNMMHHANFGTASSSLTRFFKDKQGFQAPAGYGGKAAAAAAGNAGQGAAGGSAFQVVASSTAGSAQESAGGGGRGGRAGLIDSLPSAIDVSGLGSIGGFGAAGIGSNKNASGSGARAQVDKPPLQPLQKGGLLGMLEQHHAAAAQQQQWGHSNSNSQHAWDCRDSSRGEGGTSNLGDLLQMGSQNASGGAEGGARAASGGASFGGRGLSSGRVGGIGGVSVGRSGGLLDWQALGAMPPVKGPAQRAHIAPTYEDPNAGAGGEAILGPAHKVAEHRQRMADAAAAQGKSKGLTFSSAAAQAPGTTDTDLAAEGNRNTQELLGQDHNLDDQDFRRSEGPHKKGADINSMTSSLHQQQQQQQPQGADSGGARARTLGTVPSTSGNAQPCTSQTSTFHTAGDTGMASGSLLLRQQLSAGASSRHSGLSGQQQQNSVGGARQEASSQPSSSGALPNSRSASAQQQALGSGKPAPNTAAAAVGPSGGGSGGGADGGSSKAAAAAPVRTSPREYMDQLKRELPAEMYRTVQSLLSQYRSGKNAQQLIEGLLALLKGPLTVHLLQGFTHFLPKSDQPWVREVIKTHMDAAAAAKQNGQQGHSAQRTTAGLGPQPLQPQQQNRAHQPHQQQRQQQKQPQHAQQNTAKQQPQQQRPMQQQKLSFGVPARNPQPQANHQQQQQQHQQNAQKPGSGPQHPQKQQQQQLLPQKRARETTAPSAGAAAADRPGAQGPPHRNAPAVLSGGGPRGGLQGNRAEVGNSGANHEGLHKPNVPNRGGVGSEGRGAGLGQAGGGGASTGEAMLPRASMEPVSKRPKVAGAATLSASAACTICAACPMEAPHEAACGHLGCSKCWTLQLAQHFCCATCKRPLRRQQLIRKHYAEGS